MENMGNRVNICLVTSRDIASKLVLKPNFNKNTIFCENLIAVYMKKTQLKLDKPIYLGASILDICKNLMYDFHYNYIRKKYEPKSKLLFTDTDRLCYEIAWKISTRIFPKTSKGFSTQVTIQKIIRPKSPWKRTRKSLGCFTDEAGGKIFRDLWN